MIKAKNVSFTVLQLASNPAVQQDFPDANVPAMLAAGWIPLPEAPSASNDNPMQDPEFQAALARGAVDAATAIRLGARQGAMRGSFTAPEGTLPDMTFTVTIKPTKGEAVATKKSRAGDSVVFYCKGAYSLPSGQSGTQNFLLPRNADATKFIVGAIVNLKVIEGTGGNLVEVA